MLFVEMQVTDGVSVEGTVMIAPFHISEVEELGANVRLHMTSGNSYVITGASFAASLQTVEDAKYLKITTPENEEVVKEVEGELCCDGEACC